MILRLFVSKYRNGLNSLGDLNETSSKLIGCKKNVLFSNEYKGETNIKCRSEKSTTPNKTIAITYESVI